MKYVTSFNAVDKLAILNNDEIIPIIFIAEDSLTPSTYTYVAGPCSERKWYVFSSNEFQKAVTQ